MNTSIQPASTVGNQSFPRRLWLWLLALPVIAVMAFAIFQPIRVLPRIGIAPAYSLVDQEGKKFTSETMRGKLVLYTFGDSHCSAPCRSTNATLASMQSTLGQVQLGDIPLQFVTIFVDPAAANPAALRQLAGSLAVDAANWRFVSADSEQLKEVVGAGFDTYYGPDGRGDFTVDPVFVLVDGWGIVRAIYRTSAPDADIIKRDLTLVVQEIRNSTGVNRYAYEAAHLFLCYPK